MSDRYTDLELATINMLKALPELAGVKGWQSGLQDSLITGDAISKGFRPEELPGVVVMAALEPCSSEPRTAADIQYMIPVTVFLIGRADKPQRVREQFFPMQAAIEGAFHLARKSVNALGTDALVMGTLDSSLLVLHSHPQFYGVVEVTAKVMKVEQL